MSIRDMKGKVEDLIPVENVIVSVSDKRGLELLIPGLMEINPTVRFLSTGGTYTKIKDLLGGPSDNLLEVSEYTEFPEMEGGLVKTLHPKIHAGILGERNNPEHQKYLEMLDGGVFMDMVVVNLYPFQKVISSPDANFEMARGNIDIGGPTMIRAAAKNFPSCAAVCNPGDYDGILEHITENKGATSFSQRLKLARKVFEATAEYERAIADYFGEQIDSHLKEIEGLYKFEGEDDD